MASPFGTGILSEPRGVCRSGLVGSLRIGQRGAGCPHHLPLPPPHSRKRSHAWPRHGGFCGTVQQHFTPLRPSSEYAPSRMSAVPHKGIQGTSLPLPGLIAHPGPSAAGRGSAVLDLSPVSTEDESPITLSENKTDKRMPEVPAQEMPLIAPPQEPSISGKTPTAGVSPAAGESVDVGDSSSAADTNVSEVRRLPIGAFQHLPSVSPGHEVLGTALRRARLVKPTKGIVNAAKRERNKGAKQIDLLTKGLASPLAAYVRGFPRPSRLHPYEQAVLELTLGHGGYEEAIGSVDALRKRVLDVGKSCASLVNKTVTKKEAEDQIEKAFAHLEQLFSKRSHVVDSLKEVAKMLRGLPVVRHDIPTLCLIGAPNVGKSSLVRAISSGKPEVCNYPFTTRGIQMGHFFVGTRRHQVTDTPGLIARPDEERNNIELLTIAALTYLPTSILFVHDLTEECGTSLEAQHRLYFELRQRFGDRPWIDAISKADLLPDIPDTRATETEVIEREDDLPFEVYRKFGPPGAVAVSTETGAGLNILVEKVTTVLGRIHSAEDDDLDDEGGNDERVQGTWQEREEKKSSAADFYFPAYPGDERS